MTQPVELPIRGPGNYHGGGGPDRPKHQKQARHPRLRAPRLAQAPNFPQQQTQVIGRTFERVRLAHIGLTAHEGRQGPAGGTTR